MDRRKLLTLGCAMAGVTMAPASEIRGAKAHSGDHDTHPPPSRTTTAVVPFSVSMPVPAVLLPLPGFFGADHYRLPVRRAEAEVLPGMRTPVLTYGGGFVGPTIRATSGRPAVVTFDNQLGEPVNVHLHGGLVASEHDGHPMDVIASGGQRAYEYPNRQRGATLWYHDHSHHTEAEHLYRGLHGFYLIDDDDEKELGLPNGPYDVPILLRDALFDSSAGLTFNLMDPFTRPVILANGKPQPFFQVAQCTYRFRLLNASAHRIFQLNLGGIRMTQIATDGGLLPAPVPQTELTLTPAERVEIIVDFGEHPLGSQLVLSDTSGPVLRFDVARPAAHNSPIPQRLRPLPDPRQATTFRDLAFAFNRTAMAFEINGQTFDANRIDATVKKGATEIWRITNLDRGPITLDHNFHPHAAQFRILDRDGVPPKPGEDGLKDTAWLPPGTSVRVQLTFGDFAGRYVFHCHMLEHAGLGMMAQMEIVQ